MGVGTTSSPGASTSTPKSSVVSATKADAVKGVTQRAEDTLLKAQQTQLDFFCRMQQVKPSTEAMLRGLVLDAAVKVIEAPEVKAAKDKDAAVLAQIRQIKIKERGHTQELAQDIKDFISENNLQIDLEYALLMLPAKDVCEVIKTKNQFKENGTKDEKTAIVMDRVRVCDSMVHKLTKAVMKGEKPAACKTEDSTAKVRLKRSSSPSKRRRSRSKSRRDKKRRSPSKRKRSASTKKKRSPSTKKRSLSKKRKRSASKKKRSLSKKRKRSASKRRDRYQRNESDPLRKRSGWSRENFRHRRKRPLSMVTGAVPALTGRARVRPSNTQWTCQCPRPEIVAAEVSKTLPR